MRRFIAIFGLLIALGAALSLWQPQKASGPGDAVVDLDVTQILAVAERIGHGLRGRGRLAEANSNLACAAAVARQLLALESGDGPDLELAGESTEKPEAAGETGVDEDNGIVRGKVERGETLAEILADAGAEDASLYANAAARVFPPRSLRAGQPYVVETDPATGKLRRLEYEVNDRQRLIVEDGEPPKARLEKIEHTTILMARHGVIEDSLFQAVADIGETPQLALRLVEMFGSEINFIRDIRQGDKFSVLIEKRFREGDFRGYGRILGARFSNRGKTYEAWLFRDPFGGLQYYNSRGENLKKTLLMAPLAITRLTSSFSNARLHPILGFTRPHLGVDYGAPTGTPVKAVGDGVVQKRGRAGGYGLQIILRHPGGLESWYSHLSGYARGLKEGQRVRQGQIIGYVGSTGLSTGPHLDFRLRQNDKFINPVKAINPRAAPVEPGLMAAFAKARNASRSYLDGAPLPDHYEADSIVPAKVASRQAHTAGAGSRQVSRARSGAKARLQSGRERRALGKSRGYGYYGHERLKKRPQQGRAKAAGKQIKNHNRRG